LVDRYKRFEETSCLRFQGRIWRQMSHKDGGPLFSEVVVPIYQITQRRLLEDRNCYLHFIRVLSLKNYIFITLYKFSRRFAQSLILC
jgi:hypothetical protein